MSGARPPVDLYHRLVRADAQAEQDWGGPDRVASGGLRLIVSGALQGAGDQVVNAKTVLPWLLTATGAPAALAGLLVPLRESGSMLPQAALTPWVVSRPRRTRVWMVGAAGQGVATLAMAGSAVLLDGLAAGLGLLAALAVFAVARALCSMAAKDVQGRVIPRGQRGQVTGISTAAAGLAAVAVGVALQLAGPTVGPALLAWLLVGAAALWFAAVVVYSGIPEEPGAERAPSEPWWSQTVGMLRTDARLRTFVLARALLLVSALAPPFLVTLAVEAGSSWLAGLGSFVIAQGVASVLGGRLFGRLADRSSRQVMMIGGLGASVVVLAVVVVVALAPFGSPLVLAALVLGYLLLSLLHVGVRVARKTYVVDVASGDERTRYVAVSNTAMGAILLVIGVVSAGIATFGQLPALVFLALLGLVGVAVTRRLPEVSQGSPAAG
ncbi:hypothetical protein [Serinicoccus profundi]|uniref:hypothetical protein n=1 Tax=Serinicoccus profundi TaxID=1078471 RepID=UPI000255E680|nr:hypothetical protein [Serinicoccus profundi]